MNHTKESLTNAFLAQARSANLDVDVLFSGPINAETIIVGEGPGESEVRSVNANNPYGTPYVGGSGRLLFDNLRRYGLHRANVYVTNVVKRQISLARTGNEKHVVHRDELQKWIGLLKWELEHLPNVKTILCMGNYALEAIVGEQGVMKWRGSILDRKIGGRTVKIVTTVNPAYALRDLKIEPMFLMDLKKLDLAVKGTYKPTTVESIINPTAPQALKFIQDLRKQAKPVAYDIEVINMQTACHGISNDPSHAMCVSLRDTHSNRYTLQEEADILLALQDLVTHTPMVAHNGSFDSYWVWLKDHLYVPIWFDTLLAHHTLYPQLPHSLAFLTGQYTLHPYYKDEGKFWREGGDIDSFWRYNCIDVAITLTCQMKLQKELESQGLDNFFFDHVMRAMPHLTSATVHGVAVDMEAKAAITEKVSEDVAIAQAEFHRLVGELTGDPDYRPNPNSPSQLKTLFFDVLKLKGRGTSTDEQNRKHMMAHVGTSPLAKEMLTALGRFKEEDKFLSTYAESTPGPDNRMRCQYKQFGVASAPGRLSSTGLLDGQGMNLQNQPPRARGMFVADPGTVFVYFDLAQAEARVVAWRANIPRWKEQFEQARKDGKYDAHRALAADMFKLDYELVPEHDFVDDAGRPSGHPDFDAATGHYTIRYVAKRCRHGLNYRMQVDRLSEVTGLPYHEARKAFGLYHSNTPELRKWWELQERDFRKTRVIYNGLTPYPRRFKVIQRLDDDAMASIVAFYPQSTIGDKIVQVWYQSAEDDEWPVEARIVLDVHDNLVAIATPRVAKTALKIMKKHAEAPLMIGDIYGNKPEPLIIPADLKMSFPDEKGVHRWSNMKKVTL